MFKKIKKYIWHYRRGIIVFVLACLFFGATSAYNYYSQEYSSDPNKPDFVKWASPDETANYIFAKLFAQTGEINIYESYNLYTDDIMRPRSFRSDHGSLKPVSFLGIILIYGFLGGLTSYKIIPFLTPLFAAGGIIFYYLFIKKIFNRNVAFYSAFLLAVFPPYIYYTVRSMFHNVLFTVFLLISLFFAYLMIEKKNQKIFLGIKNKWLRGDWRGMFFAALSGAFMGLAIITRASELLWLLPLFIFLWLFNIKRMGIGKLLVFIIFLLFSLVPDFFYNQLLYGNFYYGGYPQMNTSISTLAQSGSDIVKSAASVHFRFLGELFNKIFNTIFYFGWHPRQSLEMFNYYFIKMFPVFFYSAVIGLFLFFSRPKKNKKKHWLYLGAYTIISAILVLYYGSWFFHDNPDPNSFTIGNSYTRYWLPVYLGVLPFVSYLFVRLTRIICLLSKKKEDSPQKELKLYTPKIRPGLCRGALRIILISIFAVVALQFVLTGSEEGLVYSFQQHESAKYQWGRVLELTEPNSTIITRYHDKLFFPERKVIVGLFDDKEMIKQYANLAVYLPLYYYNFNLTQKDIDYLNNSRLKEAGLQIKKIEQINSDFTLYKLYLLKKTASIK